MCVSCVYFFSIKLGSIARVRPKVLMSIDPKLGSPPPMRSRGKERKRNETRKEEGRFFPLPH